MGFCYGGPNRPTVVNKINKPANSIVLSVSKAMNHCTVQDSLLQRNILPSHHLIVSMTVSDEVSKLHLIIFLTTPSANCVDSGCWGSRHWLRSMRGLLCNVCGKTKVGCGWEKQTMMQIWNLWREQGEEENLGMERCRCRSPLKGRSRASITCLEKVPHWAEGARPPQA